jgi:hypothetical protein
MWHLAGACLAAAWVRSVTSVPACTLSTIALWCLCSSPPSAYAANLVDGASALDVMSCSMTLPMLVCSRSAQAMDSDE